MKLGVFINQEFFTDGMNSSTDLSFIRFIESFKVYFDKIEIYAPTREAGNGEGCYKCADSITLNALPYYSNVTDLARRARSVIPETVKKLKVGLVECDLLWIVGPHPLGLLAKRVARKAGCPAFYHIRGNILNDVAYRYKGEKLLLAYLYAQYMHLGSIIISRSIPTMVVGSELYDLYKTYAKEIHTISPSLITISEIEQSQQLTRHKTFASKDNIKLLFVGRPEPEKGLKYLFEAIKQFNSKNELQCTLSIVGAAQKGSEEKEQDIRACALELGISSNILWKGYVPYGKTLMKLYRNADIFILPSLTEGIPKVIYEAMAAGKPIVATNVGGIPDVVTHGKDGILIDPGNIEQIVQALSLLISDPINRKTLQVNAFDTARSHTMDKARDEIMALVPH